MLKKSMLGALTSLALLGCQPKFSEISQEEHTGAEVESNNIPKPGNEYFPQTELPKPAPNKANSIETGLKLISSKTDELGFRHIKYQPIYQGVPIWGVQTIIHINKEGKTYRVDGDVPEIEPTLDTTPQLTADLASAKALDSLSSVNWASRNTTLFVWSDQGKSSLVWQVECVDAVKRKFLLIDANNGEVLKTVEGSHT